MRRGLTAPGPRGPTRRPRSPPRPPPLRPSAASSSPASPLRPRPRSTSASRPSTRSSTRPPPPSSSAAASWRARAQTRSSRSRPPSSASAAPSPPATASRARLGTRPSSPSRKRPPTLRRPSRPPSSSSSKQQPERQPPRPPPPRARPRPPKTRLHWFLKMIFFFLTEALIFESFFHFKCGFVYFEGNTCCLLAKRVDWEVDARERHVSDEGYFETCEEASHTFCLMNFLYRVKESTVFIETEDLHSSFNDDKWITTNRLHNPSHGRSQSVSAVLAKL